ncbi:MAG: SMC-Scp complex subunit ScpB [Candidatus Acidulodesulfobacterium sp.]
MTNRILLNNYGDDFDSLAPAIEAVIFASEEPVPLKKLTDLFKVKKEDVLKAVESIKLEFNEKSNHGIYLSVNDNGISFKTKPEYFDAISGSLEIKPVKFTGPQLETLSIIAYKQPVTKNEIDAVRGFDSSGTLKFLLEKNLIKVAGRKEIVGRPLIYKTSDYFLEVFNLKNLNDLPSVKEMDDFGRKNALESLNGNDNGSDDETKEEPALFE